MTTPADQDAADDDRHDGDRTQQERHRPGRGRWVCSSAAADSPPVSVTRPGPWRRCDVGGRRFLATSAPGRRGAEQEGGRDRQEGSEPCEGDATVPRRAQSGVGHELQSVATARPVPLGRSEPGGVRFSLC